MMISRAYFSIEVLILGNFAEHDSLVSMDWITSFFASMNRMFKKNFNKQLFSLQGDIFKDYANLQNIPTSFNKLI